VRAEQDVYFTDTDYVGDARRFDMGERDHFISMEMASIGMEMMADWGTQDVAARLRSLTDRLADGLGDASRAGEVSFPQAKVRTPHILSLGFRGGVPSGLVQKLSARKIYVAPRLGRLRVSPHVYNEEADIDRFIVAFRELVPNGWAPAVEEPANKG
jgi:selenocysteine lyase/cysteine desulfurase